MPDHQPRQRAALHRMRPRVPAAGREGRAFAGLAVFVAAGAGAIFAAVYPVVLPSTLDPAFSLTISNASSSDYTLTVMSIVTAIFLPVIIAYQAWTYWIFRKRITRAVIEEAEVAEVH